MATTMRTAPRGAAALRARAAAPGARGAFAAVVSPLGGPPGAH